MTRSGLKFVPLSYRDLKVAALVVHLDTNSKRNLRKWEQNNFRDEIYHLNRSRRVGAVGGFTGSRAFPAACGHSQQRLRRRNDLPIDQTPI